MREFAAEALADLEIAGAKLATAKVECPRGGRMDQALEILHAMVKPGNPMRIHRGDDLGLRAVEFALDYSAIADSLPSPLTLTDRRELRDSLTGGLVPPPERLHSLQLQSQAIVFSAFSRGGLEPTRPSTSAKKPMKSPDLLVGRGTALYGVEAKRPQRIENALPRFQDGVEQLKAFGVNGGVLIDLSDCVRQMTPTEIDGVVESTTWALNDVVFEEGRGHRPGFRHVMIAGCYARLVLPIEADEQTDQVRLHTSSMIGVFAYAERTLLHHHARWLREGAQDGLDLLFRTRADDSFPGAT